MSHTKLLLVAIACLFFLDGYAQGYSDDFVITRYGLNDGLPLNSTNETLQSPDRYLWIPTFNGLVRYDGHEFKVYDSSVDPAFRNVSIMNVHVSKVFTGFWFILDSGGIIYYDYSSFRFIGEDDGLTDRRILSITDHPSGIMIFGTDVGAFIYDGESFTKMYEYPNPIQNRTLTVAYIENDIWLATFDGVVHFNLEKQTGVRIPRPDYIDEIYSVHMHVDGYPIAGGSNGVHRIIDGKFDRQNKYLPLEDKVILHVRTIDKDIYFGDGKGFYRERDGVLTRLTGSELDPNSLLLDILVTHYNRVLAYFTGGELIEIIGNRYTRFDLDNGLGGVHVNHVFEDDEQNLWLSTRFGGLIKLTKNPFTHYGVNSGMGHDNMLGIFEDSRGRLWMSVRDHGIYVMENGSLRLLTDDTSTLPLVVHSIAEDRNGFIWLGTYQLGVFKIAPDGGINRVDLGFISGHNTVYSMHYSRDVLWIGTADGLIALHDDGTRMDYNIKHGLPHPIIRFITEDSSGNIWVATQGNGIAKLVDDTFDTSMDVLNLGISSVRAIYVDDEMNGIWIGAETNGLYFISDSYAGRINKNNGLPDNTVHSITDTKDGKLWMHTNRGIFFGNKEDLVNGMKSNNERVNIVVLDGESGMRNSEGNGGFNPSAFISEGGLLHFSTQSGVAVINPHNFSKPESQVTLQILGVVTDEAQIAIDNDSNIYQLPVGKRDFTITFTGINFSAPHRLNFRYRLVGYDSDWVDVGTRRFASFTNIPGSTYQFELSSTDIDGTWLDNPISVVLVLPKYWYETSWFYVGVILLTMLLIYSLIRYRLRKYSTIQSRLKKLVAERTKELEREKIAAFERNQIIEKQSEELSELNKAKDRFIYLLGHDMRSPLQSLLGTTEILDSEFENLTLEERRELLYILKLSFSRINTLITDLLDWAQLDAGLIRPTIKAVNIEVLTSKIADLLSNSADGKNIDIYVSVSPDLIIETDENMLEIALRNLISNAIKFSKKDSEVSITSTQNADSTVITVKDSGIGMSEDIKSNLFTVGKINSRPGTENEKGTGFGLLMAGEIFNLLQATIQVESQEDVGTEFIITIPNKLTL
jgi:signal transduction histidine kinase/streptogramin lyase